MTVLDKLACRRGIRGEEPNRELAAELIFARDREGIRLLTEQLTGTDKAVAHDGIKVLYEIGYAESELIRDGVDAFLKLILSRDNRMVWGAMIALSTIAHLEAEKLFSHLDVVKKAIDDGSVITRDAGIKTLAGIAAARPEAKTQLFPYLIRHFQTEEPKYLPARLEACESFLLKEEAEMILRALHENPGTFKKSHLSRINAVLKKHGSLFSP